MSPVLQISLGLLSLTISLIFAAYAFGLFPNEEKAALQARARIAESLAVQFASLAGRNDADAIMDTIDTVLNRDGDVLSIGIRGPDGKLIVGSKDHQSRWKEPADGKSTPTHVQVPLFNGDVPTGRIELLFRPLPSGQFILGVPQTLIGFVGFMAIIGFAGTFCILKYALWELDPGRVIPERVKAAFDALAEGILILDEKQRVVLANQAFVNKIHGGGKSLLGADVNGLPWALVEMAQTDGEAPWQTALRMATPVLDVPMAIHRHSGEVRRLSANATCIIDGSGHVRGVIATFDDVTLLHQTNELLNESMQRLHGSQARIFEQNRQLQFLASCDSMTGCLNRRTFFEQAEQTLRTAQRQRQSMAFLMLDADHFKTINDRFGHVTGDKVLIGLAGEIKAACREQHLVGRYGGEEFCIAVTGLPDHGVERLAERIRLAVASHTDWLPNGESVTVSIGIASINDGSADIADLVKRADEALYRAKVSGRNRYVCWETMDAPAKPKQIA